MTFCLLTWSLQDLVGKVYFQFEIELCHGKPIVLTTDLDIFCWFNLAEAEIKYANYLTSHFCVDMQVS